ncbi:hypothetical protein [Acetobacterium woodii]|uniref:Uncharacterized protein n=1 Tax=Acetobacterium woodii (strain ATCC 29683 / DSM 1030 / JCM 2381 / KCTC 1655 / WB1) TaxID=931626 RepID=H6LKW9_ACEWD|nr:hypothetical protein [Acetobacterium woodii]AFA50078.1 hypothetical protein Awo_c33500 [Acetobacterium woodii DSM 1030]
MNKCAYCHNEIHEPHPVVAGKNQDSLVCCSESCVEKVLAFYNFFDRTKIFFFIGLTLFMILLFGSVFLLSLKNMWLGSLLMGSSFGLLGLLVILFPFATPQTFDLLGIQKTISVTRLLGLFVLALGPLLTYWLRL